MSDFEAAIEQLAGGSYLVAHGESTIVGCGSPKICDESNVEKIHKIQPTVENEPAGLPVVRHEIGVVSSSKGERIEEEESENGQNATQDAPPKSAVHHGLDGLFAVNKIFQCST